MDTDWLVQTKIAASGQNIHKSVVKVGLDQGQGSLKIATTVEELDTEAVTDKENKRSSYKDVCNKLVVHMEHILILGSCPKKI